MNNNILLYGGDLIGQGADGCIHKPPIFSCNIKKYMNKKYISKLQFYNLYSKNEINASRIINSRYTYKQYKNYFSVLVKNCVLNFIELNDIFSYDNNKNCFFYNQFYENYDDYDTDQLFSVSVYKYVSGYSLKDFFDIDKTIVLYQNDIYNYFKQSIKIFFYLQKSLFILNKKLNYVHNDLHYNNVIINTNNNNLPVIIDFGRSFQCVKNNLELYDKFVQQISRYSFKPERAWDSFDVRFICYIFKDKSLQKYYQKNYKNTENFLNNKIIDDFIDIIVLYDFQYYKYISNFKYDLVYIQNMYQQFLKKFFYKFSDKDQFPYINDVVYYIYNNTVLSSIDTYTSVFSFIDFFLSNYHNFSKQKSIYSFVQFFIKYLFVNINPNFNTKFVHIEHYKFFKHVYNFFKDYENSNSVEYDLFYRNILIYFQDLNIDSNFFLYNDIFKHMYDNRNIIISIFDK